MRKLLQIAINRGWANVIGNKRQCGICKAITPLRVIKHIGNNSAAQVIIANQCLKIDFFDSCGHGHKNCSGFFQILIVPVVLGEIQRILGPTCQILFGVCLHQ